MEILIFFGLIAVGWFFGRLAEARHYRSLAEREAALSVPTSNGRGLLGPPRPVREARMVRGSVVISVDYFKRVAGQLRALIGGGVRSYQSLVERARREAILRMKESCPEADQLINLRLETSSIYQGQGGQIGSVEVIAYATAIVFEDEPAS